MQQAACSERDLQASTLHSMPRSIVATLATFGVFTTGLVRLSGMLLEEFPALALQHGGPWCALACSPPRLCSLLAAAFLSSPRFSAPLTIMFVVRPFTRPQLTWFTQPYVQRLRYDPATDTVEATTLSLLAQPRTDRFHLNEVSKSACAHLLGCFTEAHVQHQAGRPVLTATVAGCWSANEPCRPSQVTEADSVHPLTSFAARGRKYYVDAQNFPNQELLVRGAVACEWSLPCPKSSGPVSCVRPHCNANLSSQLPTM